MAQELALEFVGIGEVRGFQFKQIHKSDEMFMYEVRSLMDGGGYSEPYYEVFERRISKASESTLNGVAVTFKEREMYPHSNSFGVWAWCFNDYEKALWCYDTKNTEIREKNKKKS